MSKTSTTSQWQCAFANPFTLIFKLWDNYHHYRDIVIWLVISAYELSLYGIEYTLIWFDLKNHKSYLLRCLLLTRCYICTPVYKLWKFHRTPIILCPLVTLNEPISNFDIHNFVKVPTLTSSAMLSWLTILFPQSLLY